MLLNATQRKILLAGIAVIVLMGLYPPWTSTFDVTGTHSEEPAGYSYIMSPPSRKGIGARYGVKMDMSRLLIQWAVTIAASGIGVLVTAKRKDEQNS